MNTDTNKQLDRNPRADKQMKNSTKVVMAAVAIAALTLSMSGAFRPATVDVSTSQRDTDVPSNAVTSRQLESGDSLARVQDGNVEAAAISESGATARVYTMDIPLDDPVPVRAPADPAVADKSGEKKAGSPADKMSAPVAALAASGGPQLVDIVVTYDDHPELFDDEVVADLGGEVVRGYQSLEMRAIRLPADSLDELAVEDNVDWLSLDNAVGSLSVSSRATANLPADTSANAAFHGLGVGVAIIDTGISKHSDLADAFIQYSFLAGAYPTPTVENGEITLLNDDMRDDRFGHGTHVAGIITGDGLDSGGTYEGSAQSATLLALQVLDHQGGGQMSDVLAALDWLYEYGAYFDIRVVNLSLGMGIAESNATDPLVLAAERLWDAGMVVVVAAGNEGFHGNMTITSPGNSRKVITVGSLTDNGTGDDITDDYVSSFSSRGPTVGDYVLKPDLVAPGNRLVAAVPKNSALLHDLADRVVPCTAAQCDDSYLELSGTSMATPMVTAAVARMLEKDSGLSPATVKARLMRSARKIIDEPTSAGAGVLDVDAALNDTGVVIGGDALSPLMVRDDSNSGILIEDTAELWGDVSWAAGYLFDGGFEWSDGHTFSGDGTGGVSANGYLWTDGGVWANGYLWTDGGIWAKGYLWTDGDGVNAESLFDGSEETGFVLNDDD